MNIEEIKVKINGKQYEFKDRSKKNDGDETLCELCDLSNEDYCGICFDLNDFAKSKYLKECK